jgi:L-ascorbate metabolism protein UlaG (beta-lactamase superfamily)
MRASIRQVAKRLTVDTAMLHLGAVQSGITGPVRYTMTAREAVALCKLLRPRTVLPVHYEGWYHFREGRQAIEAVFAAAPDEVHSTLRWLPLGRAVRL